MKFLAILGAMTLLSVSAFAEQSCPNFSGDYSYTDPDDGVVVNIQISQTDCLTINSQGSFEGEIFSDTTIVDGVARTDEGETESCLWEGSKLVCTTTYILPEGTMLGVTTESGEGVLFSKEIDSTELQGNNLVVTTHYLDDAGKQVHQETMLIKRK